MLWIASTAGVKPMAGEKQFSASAVNLNYVEHGPPSAAPLVMLHGGAWRWQEYLSLIPSLGQRWHTYAVDLRGNGRSGWPSALSYYLRLFQYWALPVKRPVKRFSVIYILPYRACLRLSQVSPPS